MTRLKYSKILVWLFSMFFLWLNFVVAQTCPSSPNSVNSNNWLNYTQTLTTSSQETWYINTSSTINSICWSNPNCKTYVCNTVTKSYDTTWRRQECVNSMSNLFTKQKSLRQKYSEIKNNTWDGNYSTDSVKSLQELMKIAGCQDHVDCKLWVKTSHAFLFCPICTKINPWWKDLDINQNCPSWYIPAWTWDICCQPWPTSCQQPTITINNWNTVYSGETDIPVVVDYSANTVSNIVYDYNKIVVDWADKNSSYQTWGKKITFTIKPKSDSNTIKVDVQSWCAVLPVNIQCPPIETKINRKTNCQLTKDWWQCENKSGFNITNESSFTWFSSILSFKCKKWTLEIPFCPDPCTSRKIDTQTCKQTYGSWSFSNGKIPACCDKCLSNQKVNSAGTGCECSKTQDDCKNTWDKLNDKTCKCECDSSKRCCWILLNTIVPFIWDCIEMTSQNDVWSSNNKNTSTVNQLNAFPFLMMWLSKILVTAILIFSFLIVIVSWLMMVTWVYDDSNYKKWMEWIKKVVVALILLWSSWLILKLINPSFFGG